MNMDDMIKRINELAKIKKERPLSDDEQAEQKELYKKYLANFRKNFFRVTQFTKIVSVIGCN